MDEERKPTNNKKKEKQRGAASQWLHAAMEGPLSS